MCAHCNTMGHEARDCQMVMHDCFFLKEEPIEEKSLEGEAGGGVRSKTGRLKAAAHAEEAHPARLARNKTQWLGLRAEAPAGAGLRIGLPGLIVFPSLWTC